MSSNQLMKLSTKWFKIQHNYGTYFAYILLWLLVCVWPCDRLATCPGCTPPLASWQLRWAPVPRYPDCRPGVENGWMEEWIFFVPVLVFNYWGKDLTLFRCPIASTNVSLMLSRDVHAHIKKKEMLSADVRNKVAESCVAVWKETVMLSIRKEKTAVTQYFCGIVIITTTLFVLLP